MLDTKTPGYHGYRVMFDYPEVNKVALISLKKSRDGSRIKHPQLVFFFFFGFVNLLVNNTHNIT